MAKKPSTRSVRCYLCEHAFDIPRDAITTSCPACFKRVVIEDIVVRHAQGNTVLGTCGRLIVQPRASVVARRIRAIEGVEMRGTLEAAVESDGAVKIGATGVWKGDCRARAIVVEAGATILGGHFAIGNAQPVSPRLPGGSRATVRSGAAPSPRGESAGAETGE